MRILHYALGFPPYRRGGLTKYCMDIMSCEASFGHNVSLLWPGKIINDSSSISFINHKTVIYDNEKIKSIEMRNPLPVPIIRGVYSPLDFMKKKSIDTIYSFLLSSKYDVIHVHTLMGLPSEFVEAANNLNMPLFYTTHDYYGICPLAVLYNEALPCSGKNCFSRCCICNASSPTFNALKFTQSPFYLHLKNNQIIRTLFYKMGNEHKEKKYSGDYEKAIQYKNLQNFYLSMLNKFNLVLFNSNETKNTFLSSINLTSSYTVLGITNKEIPSGKIKYVPRSQKNKEINLGYLGPRNDCKGYFWLINSIDSMPKRYKEKIKLHVFFREKEYKSTFIVTHKPYNYKNMSSAISFLDIIIVPSLWKETFGFVTLEALSQDIPVIVTDNVGSKDLIESPKNGFIINSNPYSLISLLEKIIDNPSLIDNQKKYISSFTHLVDMNSHTKYLISLYYTKTKKA